MNLKHTLKCIGKNLAAIGVGAILGSIVSLIYGLQFWLPQQMAELSGLNVLFGGLALMIITFILFTVLGAITGGLIGLIVYQIIRFKQKRKRVEL